MHVHMTREVSLLLQSLRVLIVEDNTFTQKVQRGILAHLGVKTIHEASDGLAGLEAIRTHAPDLAIIDWNLPLLNGAEMVRMIRTPGSFPLPDIPIIMLTVHGERWRVIQSQKLGANEFLVKPVSAQTILDRIVSIFMHPRPIIRLDGYYGPEPRGPFLQLLQHERKRPVVPAPQ
jgi:two-component system, chemotaxis family, chemotaxis protein CheY